MRHEIIPYNGYGYCECKCSDSEGAPGFKIFETLESGKIKMRRHSHCNKYTGKRDRGGNKLYTSFESVEQAIERAKNYIDNHIIPWSERLKILGRDK